MYFQNPYLYNPAMAGANGGLDINTDYRQQWNSFPGSPRTASLTVGYQPAEKVGLGLNINDDQAGLIRDTRIMATYAYHLPVSQNGILHMGLSLGMDDSRVNNNAVNGDITDQEIALYNQLKPYVDGDLGIAYTNTDLYISGALSDLRSTFFGNSDTRFDVDRLLFIVLASYKFPLQSEDRAFVLEPLAAFRAVKGNTGIVDAGFNFTLNNYGLYIQSVYHSNKNLGLGFGLDQRSYMLNFAYNLETGPLAYYTQGAFELGIKIRIAK